MVSFDTSSSLGSTFRAEMSSSSESVSLWTADARGEGRIGDHEGMPRFCDEDDAEEVRRLAAPFVKVDEDVRDGS